MSLVKCAVCRTAFHGRSDAKVCSHSCRQTLYRRRMGVTARRHFKPKRGQTNVHFSSETFEWATPQDVFDRLNSEFGFTIDVCATADNAKVVRFYTVTDDGLAQP
jgi:DNA N-6-adenine-methyltransferase (Dam)